MMRRLILWCSKRRLGLIALGLTLLFCFAAVPPLMHEDHEFFRCTHCGAWMRRDRDFFGRFSGKSVGKTSLTRWSAEHEAHEEHEWFFSDRTHGGVMGEKRFAPAAWPPICDVSSVLSKDNLDLLTRRLGVEGLRNLLDQARGDDLQKSQAAIKQIRSMVFVDAMQRIEQNEAGD